MTRAPPPTPDQLAAVNRATFRPTTPDDALRTVHTATLLASLDDYPPAPGRTVAGGGLYRVCRTWPHRDEWQEAVVAVREPEGLRWYVARVKP